MDKQAIFEKAKEIFVREWDVPAEDITMESDFFDDLNADSLDMVDMVTEMESEFGISISDDAAEKIKTVGDAVNYIAKMLE